MDRARTRAQSVSKRAIDIVLGLPAALVTLPIVLAMSVGATLALKAAPLFSQERVGRHQRPFVIVKVRTLPPSAPRDAAKYDLDTRQVPRFTRWLRKRHLDELPQLWNVVTGSMALVGPRPEMARLHEQMPNAFAHDRTKIRPGCTGLWQISPHAAGLIHESPEYDSFYVANQTLRLDFWILWQTVRVLVFHRSPVTLASVPGWAIRPLRTGRHLAAPELRTTDLRD